MEKNTVLIWTGLKKLNENEDLRIVIEMPQTDNSGCFSYIEVEGVVSKRKIYAEDPISALINALSVIRSLLDPPTDAIEKRVEVTRDLLPLLTPNMVEQR